MATKKKQKDAKTGREKKLQTAKRSKKAASTKARRKPDGDNIITAIEAFNEAVVEEAKAASKAMVAHTALMAEAAKKAGKPPLRVVLPTKTDESTGANVKRAVSSLLVEWPPEIDLSAFRRVVQDGVSPSDTAIRLQCRRCNQTEEILARDALAISADNPPVGFPLEAFRDWARRAKKKHRRCGGAETKGTQQSLGLWEKIR